MGLYDPFDTERSRHYLIPHSDTEITASLQRLFRQATEPGDTIESVINLADGELTVTQVSRDRAALTVLRYGGVFRGNDGKVSLVKGLIVFHEPKNKPYNSVIMDH